jgi:transcriptional regulator with XRE-family HTH domain
MSFDLRAERMNRGLTQAELARLLHVDRGTIIRVERGSVPLAGTALKIAQWAGHSPAELWPPEPDRSPA